MHAHAEHSTPTAYVQVAAISSPDSPPPPMEAFIMSGEEIGLIVGASFGSLILVVVGAWGYSRYARICHMGDGWSFFFCLCICDVHTQVCSYMPYEGWVVLFLLLMHMHTPVRIYDLHTHI